MATPTEKRTELRETLGVVLAELGSQVTMAACLGVSTKTLERYLHGRAFPPPGRRSHLLQLASRHLEAPLAHRLAMALGVPEDAWPTSLRTAQGELGSGAIAALEPALDMALFAAAERHGIAPAAARRVVLDVLARAMELGVDARTTHDLVASIATKRAAH